MSSTRRIYVSRNGQSNNIKLRDNEGNNPGNDNITTDVNPGDQVVWEIDPNENDIYSIEGIAQKPGTTVNLLSTAPTLRSDGSYSALVSSDANLVGQEESYNVSYRITNGGTIYTDDPKLKMKN